MDRLYSWFTTLLGEEARQLGTKRRGEPFVRCKEVYNLIAARDENGGDAFAAAADTLQN